MVDAGTSANSAPRSEPGGDPGAAIAALRERGADRFDPVGFHFIEALARRTAAHQGDARRVLDGKLATALSAYRTHLGPAQEGAETVAPQAASQSHGRPLAELVRALAQRAPEDAAGAADDHAGANAGPPAELKSLRYFRSTWARLSVDQQLSQALAQAPTNAGPLNSHLLVLQSIRLMQELSPDYLKRFMSYVDTLLWLEQANGGGAPLPKELVRGEPDKKRKSGRAKSG